ncbi:MAG TPA: hypothetical protein VLC49_06620 [Solirubrobacteraceae bacterium]|nr:hypothetical protein [Solirubrobacteraceae bacterium]
MKRFAAVLCVLLGVLVLPPGALATGSHGRASGTVIGVAGHTFAVEAHGGRMSVVAALAAAADGVTAGDFPYVYGGGHGEAGIASIGLKGPGFNGRRIGFDCSGSVAAVLASAGLWPVATGVPSDAGVISQLLHAHLIARGRGHGPTEVTLYDDTGVHIFMDIDGRFFGTSDGAGGGNPNGGAGWLDDGAPDASSHRYKPYHLLPGVLREQTSLERIFTFQTRGHAAITHGLMLGSVVHVGYTVAPNGSLVAQSIR